MPQPPKSESDPHDRPATQRVSRWVAGLTGVTLTAVIVTGGSSQNAMISTSVAELLSLPLILLSLWLGAGRGIPGGAWPIAILGAGVLVVAAQLVPLPLSLWSALPGRQALLAAMTAVGPPPAFLPASLNPTGTAHALASLLPGVAMFMGTAVSDMTTRRWLIWLLLGLGGLSALLGIVQATGAAHGFYSVTNPGSALGFFANRNHFAALMYVLPPLATAVAWYGGRGKGARRRPTPLQVGAVVVVVLCLLALAASGSRAGLGLAVLSLLGCALLVARRGDLGRRGRWVTVLAAGAVILGFGLLQFARIGVSPDPGARLADEGRGLFTATTLKAAGAYAPLGSGLGTFAPIYAGAEPAAAVTTEYVNHAHDDWAELWLEASWPMALVAAAFLAWFAWSAAPVWKAKEPPPPDRELGPARAASLVILLLLVHSAVDYPLRTGAVMAVFGLACALLVPAPHLEAAPASRRRKNRHHRTAMTQGDR